MSDTTLLLDELLERVVAIQKEIDIEAVAKRYYFYTQPGFPYWTNRIARLEPQTHLGEGDWIFAVTVEMRYHAGQATEGADGDLEIEIQGFIVDALTIFKGREGLESTAFPDWMDALEVGNISVASRGVGTIPISNSGLAKGSIFDLGVNVTLSTEGL